MQIQHNPSRKPKLWWRKQGASGCVSISLSPSEEQDLLNTAHLWIQDGTCWSIFKCSRWWGSDYAFKAFQHHWGQQLSYVVLLLSPRSLRQQYFNFRKAQGQGDDGVLINPSRAADLKSTTLLLVDSGRGAVTCKRLWNFLSLAEGEKKLGTSFSLPNLSEPWQLSVFFSIIKSIFSADHRQRDQLLQTATEENHTYLSPDVQAVIPGCLKIGIPPPWQFEWQNQGIGVPYFQTDH